MGFELATDYNDVASRIVEFRERVQQAADGCWLWQGKRQRKGYGVVYFAGREYMAHRVFYTALRGEIPPGLALDHLCRTPPCVNPDHLEPVTWGENVRRGMSPVAVNQRKTHCIHGHSLADAYNDRGSRACRTCRLARERAKREARRG